MSIIKSSLFSQKKSKLKKMKTYKGKNKDILNKTKEDTSKYILFKSNLEHSFEWVIRPL